MTDQKKNSTTPSAELSAIADALEQADFFETVTEVDRRLSWLPRNDMGNAKRLMERHGKNMLYVRNVGWHWYTGKFWDRKDGESAVQIAAQQTAASIKAETAAIAKYGKLEHETEKNFNKRLALHHEFGVASGNSPKISGMINQAEPHMVKAIADIDAAPWLYNCENGTLNLKEILGADAEPLQSHNRQDFISRLAPVRYDGEADAPRWRAFLNDILPDQDVQSFIQRWFGYCLTGDTGEQFVVMLHGQGANGKSTMIDVMTHLLGDYAMTINFSSLLHDDRKRGSEASPDLARLPGARAVVAAEPEIGARFSESLLKSMTGGDVMTVRHLNKDFFEFTPQFKLTLAFNNKPQVRGNDEGIWRRLLLVPFENIIPKAQRDPQLKIKLRAEASGILNWMLDGLRLYLEKGLQPPDAVQNATREYREDNDPVGQYMALCVVRKAGCNIEASDLYELYKSWCRDNAADPVSKTAFGKMLGERGYEKAKMGNIYYKNLEFTEDARAKLNGLRLNDRNQGGDHD